MEEMKIVTLDELKKQMRVDIEEEDSLITLYGAAAEDYVIESTRRSIPELNLLGYVRKHGGEDLSEPDAVEISRDNSNFPQPLKVAILMYAAHLYRNREPVAGIAQNAVPHTLDALIKPYRRLSNKIVNYVDKWNINGTGGDPGVTEYEYFTFRREPDGMGEGSDILG